MTVEDDRREAERLQRLVVDHKGRAAYVSACPGAGKTSTMVRRVQRLSSTSAPRRGVAVLSFTNAAVDEFRKRCREQGILEPLRFPHFISTFDSFLNHFLVMPFGAPSCTSRPMIVDSWDHIKITHGKAGTGAFPLQLSRFDADTGVMDPSTLNDKRIPKGVFQHQLAYEARARQRRKALNGQGLLSADDARLLVRRFLDDKSRADAVGRSVAARFSEVIVDEAQDCNDDDAVVLEWLKRHDVSLLVVCDPDQAIFEFRKRTNGAFRTFVHGLPALTMRGNFRSSRNICAVAGTMRSSRSTDLVVGPNHDVPHPIALIPYMKSAAREIGVAFKKQSAIFRAANCMLLAHKRSLALRASGAPPVPSAAGGRLRRLARLVVAFHASAVTGKQRESTVKAMIRLLLEIEGKPEDDVASLRLLAKSPEVDRAYRRKAFEILAGLPPTHSEIGVDEWADMARTLVAQRVALADRRSIKQELQNRDDWHATLKASAAPTLPCATVHEAKGRDYEAVCLVLDNGSEAAVTAWENGDSDNSESLRVLYVGVTRAEKFLAIAAPVDLLDRIEAILAATGVPTIKEPCSRSPPEVSKRTGVEVSSPQA